MSAEKLFYFIVIYKSAILDDIVKVVEVQVL